MIASRRSVSWEIELASAIAPTPARPTASSPTRIEVCMRTMALRPATTRGPEKLT
jgi:hypothetical protein